MDLLTELNKCRTLKWGDPDKPGDEDSVVYLCALAADEITSLTAENAALREWGDNAHKWLIDHRELELSGKSHWVAGLISTYPAAIDEAEKGEA